jgi:predicted AlkP superfamily pyrophosphatase or phosphodiesterase
MMRRLIFFLISILALLPLSAQESTETPSGFATNTPIAATRTIPSHVLVISMDGARPDAILQSDTPVLQELAASGAVDWEAQTVLPAATIPAHASLLTGLSVEEHGVDYNSYNTETLDLPTFLSIAAENGIPCAMIVGKNKLDQFHYPETVYYEFPTSGDGSVVDAAINRLILGDRLLFVHLPNPDYFGHSTGWMSETYLHELGNTDRQIGRLLTTLEEIGVLETSLIIITADHGGHEMEHGYAPEDRIIPLIITGTGVQAGLPLENSQITQIAATVLWALDLPIPPEMDAPLIQAFAR